MSQFQDIDLERLVKIMQEARKRNYGKFKCWDCEEELPNTKMEDFDEETVKTLESRLSSDGYHYIICEKCWEKVDDY